MKPRNKRQAEVLGYAPSLPAISDKHRDYMVNDMEHLVLYKMDGRCKCTACGHEYRQMPAIVRYWRETIFNVLGLDEQCPACGRMLKPKHHWEYRGAEGRILQIITTHRGYQVFRYVECAQSVRWGQPTTYSVNEQYQQWIDSRGREVIVTRPYSRGGWWLNWKYDEDWTIGHHNDSYTGYYAYNNMFNGHANLTYPIRKVIPELKCNGWCGECMSIDTKTTYLAAVHLLSDNLCETLAKTGHWGFFYYMVNNGDRLKEYRPLIMVCIRHHYKVADIGLWLDMIRALQYLGKDTHNPHYLCPENLRQAHDYWMKKRREKEEAEERKKRAEQDKEYRKHRLQFEGFLVDGPYDIRILMSATELFEEGRAMHHCVDTYRERYDSLILSIRNKAGARLETAEVNLKRYNIVQCRGLQNCPSEEHDKILLALKEILPEIRRCNEKLRRKKSNAVAI